MCSGCRYAAGPSAGSGGLHYLAWFVQELSAGGKNRDGRLLFRVVAVWHRLSGTPVVQIPNDQSAFYPYLSVCNSCSINLTDIYMSYVCVSMKCCVML